MLLGILLGISLALFAGSVFVLISDFPKTVQDTIVTGAVIGSSTLSSYALVALAISIIALVFIFILFKMRREEEREQPFRFRKNYNL